MGNARGAIMNKGRFFEDFQVGESIHHATPRTLSAGDVSLYIALTGSRFPLHCASTVAQQFGFPEMPVDDLLVFHIAFGKTVPDISFNAIANLGYADVRFIEPVYVGDTLNTITEVIGLRENSNGKSGIVYVRSVAYNQHQVPVLSWIRWVMVRKSKLNAPAPQAHIPELPSFVASTEFTLPAAPATLAPHSTGDGNLWDDFHPGLRIDHPTGMTIDATDHTLATKLYQNTARVHFDAHWMAQSPMQQRLMYGGHVISICRALSYEGLANAVLIKAIHGGQHTHPCFAGDTLYCWSEVLEQNALPGRTDLGALRLRLVGVKNIAPETLLSATLEHAGKTSYRPEVVLDLDYSVLMPRRTAPSTAT